MAKRRAWTPEELEQLNQGIKPEGRTEDAYHNKRDKLKAQGLSIPAIDKRRPWTQAEKDLLDKGIMPEGRTGKAVSAFKIAQRKKADNVVTIKTGPWSLPELALAFKGIKPKGRTTRDFGSIRYDMRRSGFEFPDIVRKKRTGKRVYKSRPGRYKPKPGTVPRVKSAPKPLNNLPSGSVLVTASTKAAGFTDLLALSKLVPVYREDLNDVVSEAWLYMNETGCTQEEAVKQALRLSSRFNNKNRYHVNFDDVFHYDGGLTEYTEGDANG